MALFTRMIIGPAKAIERMINRLGTGRTIAGVLNALKALGATDNLRIIWLSERLAWLESQRHNFYAIFHMN